MHAGMDVKMFYQYGGTFILIVTTFYSIIVLMKN